MRPSTAIKRAREKLQDRWEYHRLQYSNELALEALSMLGYSSEEAYNWLESGRNDDGSIEERMARFMATHERKPEGERPQQMGAD